MPSDPLHEALESHPDLEAAWENCNLIVQTMWHLSEVPRNVESHDIVALFLFAGNWSDENVSNAEQAIRAVQLELDAHAARSAAADLARLLRRTWELIKARGVVALRDLMQAEAEKTGHTIDRWLTIGDAVSRLERRQCLSPEELEENGWQDQESYKLIRQAVCGVQWQSIRSTLSLIFDLVSLRDLEDRLGQQFSGAVLSRGQHASVTRPGFLGLIVDHGKRTVRRVGHEPTVDLSRADISWFIFRRMLSAKDRGTTNAALENGYPGEWSLEGKRSAVASLRNHLIPLSITIPSGKLLLVDMPDAQE